MDVLALTLRLWIVLVFVAALAGKLSGRAALREFRAMLVAIGVPAPLVTPVGAAVIGAEAAVAVLGLPPVTGVPGMAVAAALMAVFTVGVAVAVRRRSTASCRCFGGRGGRLHTVHVVRNAMLTAVSAVAAVVSFVAADGVPALPVAALAAVAAGAAALVVVRWEDVASLFVDVPA